MSNPTGPTQPKNQFNQRGQPLTPRQAEVMDYICLGMNNKEIARAMGITQKGVEAHVQDIYYKIGTGRRVLAALWWQNHATKPS